MRPKRIARPVLSLPGLTLLVAVAAEVAFDFGQSVELNFYAAVAQIIPLLLIAFFIEASAVLAYIPEIKDDYNDMLRQLRAVEDRVESLSPTVSDEAEGARREADDIRTGITAARGRLEGGAKRLRRFMLRPIALAVVGEATALVALGAGVSSTFLLVVTVMSPVLLAYILVLLFLERFG